VDVENEPAALLSGHDTQLETAIAILMKQIAAKPAGLPPPPALLPAYPPSGIVSPKP
jgi:tricorn protease